MQQHETGKFAIYAEADGYSRPMLMLNIPFGRLMDEIVLPYQTDQPFFIDGAPLKRANLKKLKILRLTEGFQRRFADINSGLHEAVEEYSRIIGEQYNVRLEASLREEGEDVTSQIISAFDRTIKPSLKDYLPKREELIQTALQFFLKNVSQLAGVNT